MLKLSYLYFQKSIFKSHIAIISFIKICLLSFELFSYCDTEIYKTSRSLVVPISYYRKILCIARGGTARTRQISKILRSLIFVNMDWFIDVLAQPETYLELCQTSKMERILKESMTFSRSLFPWNALPSMADRVLNKHYVVKSLNNSVFYGDFWLKTFDSFFVGTMLKMSKFENKSQWVPYHRRGNIA